MPIEQITFTSDGNGSMPLFDESGKLKGLGICSVESLYEEVKKAILEENIKIEDAIKVITSNIAHILKFKHKGKIEKDMDADIVIVDDNNLNIDKVIAMGNVMVDGGEAKVLGTFEN